MPKPEKVVKKSLYYRLFFVFSLVFLLVGLCFLGSFRGTGEAYELKAKAASGGDTPSVVFRLSNPSAENGSLRLQVMQAYVNVGAVYGATGTGTLRLESGASATSYSSGRRWELTFDAPGAAAQTDEDEAAHQTLYRWAAFPLPETGWRLTTYPYVRLTAQTQGCNMLINELVLVGEVLDADDRGTGEYRVVPMSVSSATALVNESTDEALARAASLIDRPRIPQTAESRFHRFSDGEIATLMTIAEMRAGNEYGAGNVYAGERVYGALGVDLLALGTLVFGMNAFGLRFFSMLAAFGTVVCGFFFVRRLTKSDKAGFVFSLLFMLSCAPMALGGLGTPLMLGVFFFAAALNCCHKFYAEGIPKVTFVTALPTVGAGLLSAAAICVNGAFVVPVLGIAGLFAAGMVRQQKARRYYLDKAIAEAEAEEAAAPAVQADGAQTGTAQADAAQPAPGPAKRRAAAVAAEYKQKNTLAVASFAVSLLLGTLLLALIGLLPAYYPYVKLYDNPASPSLSLFALMWKGFAGGFVGVNAGGAAASAWDPFYVLLRGDGANYSFVWASLTGPVSLLVAAVGIAGAVWRAVALARRSTLDKPTRAALRELIVPAAGLALSLIAAAFGGGAYGFVVLAYAFCFVLAAGALAHAEGLSGRTAAAAKAVTWVLVGLGVVWFALCFVFTTGLPLPSSLISAVFG